MSSITKVLKDKAKKEKDKDKDKLKSSKTLFKNELINKENTVLAIKGKDFRLVENCDYLRTLTKEFKALVQISLEACFLEEIPAQLFSLKSLKILNLENNSIKSFDNPNNYVLDSLEELSLTRNQLSDVSLEAIGKTFKNLKKLSISHNALKSWKDVEDKAALLDIGSSLQLLDLSFNYLKAVPQQVEELIVLKVLNLSNNAFSNFPQQLLMMQSLNTLFLQNNQIWFWLENYKPDATHSLISSLEVLDVSSNKLVTSTANEIKHFEGLQTLDLSNNKIEQLPAELLRLPTLVELYLHNNMIETTPAEVETQLSLAVLSLYGNNCKNSKTKFKSGAKILWSNTKALEIDKESKYQIATVKIDKKSSRKGNLADLLNTHSSPSSPTQSLGTGTPTLIRKKSKPELSSSQSDRSSIMFGSGANSPSIPARSSDPATSPRRPSVLSITQPPPVPPSPKSLGSPFASRVNSNPGSLLSNSQPSDSNIDNRNRGFTIGSAISPPTSPTIAPAVPPRRSSTTILKFYGELPPELQRRNSDSDSAESSPSTSRRGSVSTDIEDPRKLQVDYYTEALSRPELNRNDVATLRLVIHRVSVQWLSSFVTSGVKGIFEYLNKVNTQVKLNEDNKENILDLLAVVAYLADNHTYEMLEATANSISIAKVLVKLLAIRDPLLHLYVIKLLGKIALKAPRSIPTILEGFSANYAQAKSKNNRFDPLFEYVDGSLSYPQHALCMLELINSMINNTEDLNARMTLRDELAACGLLAHLSEWKSRTSQDIQPLMRVFQKQFSDDLEELFVQKGRQALVEYFVRNRQHFRLEDNFLVIVTNTFGFYYLLMSYDATTTFKKVIIELMKKGFIESEFHYFGLFLPGHNLPDSSPRKTDVPQVLIEPGSWLHGDVPLVQRDITGPVMFEFKYQPWSLTIQYKSGKTTASHVVEIDANRQCSDLTLALVDLFKGDLSQEWGLYYKHSESGENSAELAEWRFVKAVENDGEKYYLPLEDTEPLAKYSSVVTQSNVVELRPKFVDTLIYSEDNSAAGRRSSEGASRQKEKFRADPQLTVNKLVAQAVQRAQLGDPKDFNLVSPNAEGVLFWLNGDMTLCSLKANARMNLQLLRRYVMIQVKTGDKKVTPVKVDLAVPFKQVVESNQFPKLNAPVSQLIVYRKVHGKVMEMDINKSLLEHNINEGNKVTIITRQDFTTKETARRELAKKKINWADVEVELTHQEDIILTKTGEEWVVEASSLYQLILALINTKFGDKHFLNPFLGSLSTFMSVEDFLDKLGELFEVPKEKSHLQRRIKLRVCFILGHFIEKYYSPEDAKEVNVNKKLEHLVRNVVTKDPTIKNETVTKLVLTLFELRKENDGPIGGDVSPSVSRSNSFKLKRNASVRDIYKVLTAKDFKNMSIIDKVDWTRTELRTNEIAKQLTVKLSNIFSQLKISELLNQAWLKNKEGMVGQMVGMFNNVASWVTTTICFEHQLKKRVELMIKFIKIAKRMRELNNFHLLTAIISGLNHFAVSRLKWTMTRVPKQLLQVLTELETLMDMQGSFKNYRLELEKIEGPCIPYLGVVMKDLTFIDEGNPDWVKASNVKLINFAKRRMIYNLIYNSVLRFQQYKYDIEMEEDLQEVVNHLPRLEENIVEEQSLKIEPRNAARVDLR